MELTVFRHLIWPNRWIYIGYKIRRLFVAPAPDRDRCIMGAPVMPSLHCPRRVVPDELWCPKHMDETKQ